MAASELRCADCTVRRSDGTVMHVPFEFIPRALVRRESGAQSYVPVIRCPRCEGVEEWKGHDLMASTSDAVMVLAVARHACALEGADPEIVQMLTRIIQRFNHQIIAEMGRLARIRLGF